MGTETFVKPTRVEIDVAEAWRKLLGDEPRFVMDLCEGEQVCTECHGLAFVKDVQPYALKGDPDRVGYGFPYAHTKLRYCGSCYRGVQTICSHCSKPYPKQHNECQCEGAREAKRSELRALEAEESDEPELWEY